MPTSASVDRHARVSRPAIHSFAGVTAPRIPPSVLALLLCIPACVTTGAPEFDLDARDSVELYRRATPPKPRIPGSIATDRGHASSEAPVRLTASDGTGLMLRRLQVRAVIDDPVSLTELHLTFENPHDRVLDGQFELLLPPGADVSRFAMQVGGQWVESEVVERTHARQVYQAHKHMRRDPALLERERGRRFSGRVFPIAPRERKEIILTYTTIHEQAGGAFRVPLAGLPRIDDLDIQVVVRGSGEQLLEIYGEHERLVDDFVVELAGLQTVGLAVADQALLRMTPIPAREAAELVHPSKLCVLIDSSASTAGAAIAGEAALTELLTTLDQRGLGQLPIEIVAFDQTRERIYTGPIAGAPAGLEPLRNRARLGASDLVAAMDAISPDVDRVILISDGQISAGLDTKFELGLAIDRAGERGVDRLDAVALGAAADIDLLAWMVGHERFEPGVVFEPERSAPATWIDDLLTPAVGRVNVAIAGATEVWPAYFDGLRPGQSVVVHASFTKLAPSKAKLALSGAATSNEVVELRQGTDAMIERSIAVLRARALISEIEAGGEDRASVEHELVALSQKYQILTDYTAMLVLESEQAYAEFGIPRANPVAANAASAMTISMDEAKNLPVGSNTIRDFTAVVELAPTSSRDSAGISLAGTTGAESRYSVMAPRQRQTRQWLTRAHGSRIGDRDRTLPKAARELGSTVDDAMSMCTRHLAAVMSDDISQFEARLVLGLRFDPAGQLVEVRSSADSATELLDCVRYQLGELAGAEIDQRPEDTKPAFELLRRYTIDVTRGFDPVPADWLLPDVVEYSRERAFAGQSGAAGWAKFIDEDLAVGLVDEALDVAWTWQRARPGELLPYVSLGRALLAAGDVEDAARAYGSLIDLYPSRAEPRRFAGALLESLDDPAALDLAIDSYRKARALRPDHPNGYQALALALARRGDHQAAVDTLVDALGRTYADGQFGDAVELMRRDLATLAAVAILANPESRGEILTQLVDSMIVPEAVDREWLTLTWETDASFLALEVADGDGFVHTGGTSPLSVEVGTGFGPQGFEWDQDLVGPLRPSVLAHDLGPEGVAIGSVRRVRVDERGGLEIETRPFVIWPNQPRVTLGKFEREPTE